MTEAKPTWKDRQWRHLKVLLVIVALLWLVALLDFLLPQSAKLLQFGIWPRNAAGLRGILLSPFIHADWAHLAFNTIPFLALGWLVMLRGGRVFAVVSALAALACGLGVWALGDASNRDGNPVFHVGASGVIFGYFGYLLIRAYFERSLASLLVACAVGFFYGGLVWGLLPLEKDVSWLGHVFGFAGGALAAWALADKKDETKKPAEMRVRESDELAEN